MIFWFDATEEHNENDPPCQVIIEIYKKMGNFVNELFWYFQWRFFPIFFIGSNTADEKNAVFLLCSLAAWISFKLTWAISIHFFTIFARWDDLSSELFNTVATTRRETRLNCSMVAKTLLATVPPFPCFRARRAHTAPKQWWGTTRLNNSWKSKVYMYLQYVYLWDCWLSEA